MKMALSTKSYSNKQEELISEYLGWNRVVASGARNLYPGDIISDNWLGECKTHEKEIDKITFKISDWVKIEKEAASRFKYPVLFVDNGSQRIDATWCMFPKHIIGHNAICLRYPYSIKTNITFVESLLSNRYINQEKVHRPVAYHVDFNDLHVNICKLSEFKEMFGTI